jgi:hypothetical protein
MLSADPTTDRFSEAAMSRYATFSIDDYGKADEGPYQIVMPTYAAPKWLNSYSSLGKALRECGTLCTLRGTPFRVVRWGREGSGARGGIPCKACGPTTPNPSRFPNVRRGPGYFAGFPDAHPIAEFRPGGQRLVFNNRGVPQLVGRPNYVVSHNPFPRTYSPEVYPQQYLEAVRTAQVLANGSGKRTFICDGGFNRQCKSKTAVPVVYVDPGSLARRYDNGTTGTVITTPVSPLYFQELVAEGRGRSYLGQGA